MRSYQLEFDFVKEMDSCQSERGIIEWAGEHVRPDFGWDVQPGHEYENEKIEFGNFFQQVKDHLRVGLSFKWKF